MEGKRRLEWSRASRAAGTPALKELLGVEEVSDREIAEREVPWEPHLLTGPEGREYAALEDSARLLVLELVGRQGFDVIPDALVHLANGRDALPAPDIPDT